MATQIQVRRDLTANWSSQVLAEGELGLELDTAISGDKTLVKGIKIGDGATAWSTLEYASTVFEYPNTVVDVDNNTLYIKGLSSQTGKLLLVTDNSDNVLFSIVNGGTILFNEGGAGQVDFGGGSNSTGVTIQANGDIEMAAASRIEMGSTIAGSTSAGSGVELTTETHYGRIHLKANSSAGDTDDIITVTKNTSANFVVEADGDVTCTAVTASGLLTCAGVTNSSAVINAGNEKVTNVTDPTAAQDAATKAYVDGYNKAGHATFTVTLATTTCTTLANLFKVGRINDVTLSSNQLTVDLEADMSDTNYVTIISGHSIKSDEPLGHPMTFHTGTNGLTAKTTAHFKFKPRHFGGVAHTFAIMVSVYEA